MSIFKCKMCGGTLEIKNNESVAVCDFCGTMQTIPKLDDEKRANLYNRANHFRRNNEFDKAMGIYEMILSENNTDAEAYWSIVLCRYGIEYVEDPASHKRIPTVNKAQTIPIFNDNDYLNAIKYADGYQRDVYENEANAIDVIQKNIFEISNNEEPFDIFISYKETDSMGRRTQDSVYAQDIYINLINEGYRVFFSRITLEDKIGTAYEPYIFAALNSAKVMLVVGTTSENMNAVWVKNEWSRYLDIIKKDSSKVLIPCYRNMDPYDLPDEFAFLQAQNIDKIGFMQDLIRGIQKYISNDKEKYENDTSGTPNSKSLLKRGFMYLEDGNWKNADEYFEKILDAEPKNPKAYLGKFLCTNHILKESDIAKIPKKFDVNDLNLKKAISFSTEKDKDVLLGYISNAREEYEKLNLQIEELHDRNSLPDNQEEAYELYKLAAENGNPLAHIMLGRCYEYGYGIQQPQQIAKKQAYKSYTAAINPEGIHIEEALYEVGRCLLFGIGTEVSYQNANKYLSKSASMGYSYAEYQLGVNYCNGTGIQKALNKGIQYIKSACSKGVSIAFKALGDISFWGYYGYPKNIAEAVSKYTDAINCADYIPSGAYLNLSRCYQQKKDYVQALEILKLGAEKGYADCQNEIGLLYESGLGVQKDYEQALFWFSAAAKKGFGQAQYKLACLYETGNGVVQDINKAIELFKQAAQKDVGMANYKMGLYACGSKNYALAKTYYEKAASKNIALAYNDLGTLYDNGLIGSRSNSDLKRALSYYLQAAKNGLPMAQNNAGCMYYNVFSDCEKAHFWFKKAVDNGYQPAIANLELVIKQEKRIRTASNLQKFSSFIN